MSTLNELEAAIDDLLDHPLGIGHFQLVQHVEAKAYEAYVFGLCLRAAIQAGAIPVLQGYFRSSVAVYLSRRTGQDSFNVPQLRLC